jgi:hypothetical protein
MLKKFFLKTLIFIFGLVVLCIVAFFVPVKASRQNMLYTQIDKNESLKKTPSPRVIFVGGSNLAYGLDSKRIKDTFNINPINTGVHINIGLKYMLTNTLQYLKPGDVVILSVEYQEFYGNLANGEGELLSLVADIVPQSRSLLDYKQVFTLVKLLPEYVQSKLRPILLFYKFPKENTIGRYDRAAFNAFGDAIVHWKLSAENPKPYPAITDKINNDAFEALINFRNAVSQKKANLYITFPGYQSSSYQKSVTQIKQVKEVLEENHFKLISSPEEYIIPDSLIFDTPYHLTKKGVDYRTGLFIQDLKKVIKR